MQTQTDIEFLVQETLELAHSMGKQIEPKVDLQNVPHSMGILYRIEKKTSYSLIRCVYSENIYEDLHSLMGGGEVLSEEASHLKWFETSSQYQADFIISQFGNRRLNHGSVDLVDRDQDSWWLLQKDDSFTLSPKNFFAPDQVGLYQLGPLGEFGLAKANLEKIGQIFHCDVKVEKNKVVISTAKRSAIGDFLSQTLIEGVEAELDWLTSENQALTEYEKVAREGLKTYFSEIAILRKFQIEVDKNCLSESLLS